MPAPAGIFYWSVFLGLSIATQDVSVILAWWSIKQVNGDDLHLRGQGWDVTAKEGAVAVILGVKEQPYELISPVSSDGFIIVYAAIYCYVRFTHLSAA